jgi:hypothetical protein
LSIDGAYVRVERFMLRLPADGGGTHAVGLTLEGLFELHAVVSALLRQAGHLAYPAHLVPPRNVGGPEEPRLKQRGAFP